MEQSDFFWNKRSNLPLFLQSEISECGIACLAMIAAYHGHDVNLMGLRRRFLPNSRGTSMKHLLDFAGLLHFNARALKFEMQHLTSLQVPCILHWDLDHFVVLKSVGRKAIVIHDPALGVRQMSHAEFAKHSTGIALELTPAEQFTVIHDRPRLKVWQLFKQTSGLKRSLVQVLILSLMLMILTLGLPIFIQLILDDVLSSFDKQLLNLVILGLLAVTIFRSACGYLRGMFLLFIGKILSFNASASVFQRLLRLPLGFFERRHTGDLMSRFYSLDQINRFLIEGMIESIVDGFMMILMLAMMIVYSPRLSAFALAAVVIYGASRFMLFRPYRRLTEESIITQSREQSNFMETVRGIQSIKLYGGENERHALWQNLYSRVLNANTGLGRYRVGFQSLQDIVFGLGRAAILYVGVAAVFEQRLSIGMLIAFLSYQDQFSDKIRLLIEQFTQFRMLDLHGERIADIVLADSDPISTEAGCEWEICGKLELNDLSFRYDDQDSQILENVNLTIQAGESVAIAGPSGAGKTTLLKIMVGLFKPTMGKVLVDGHDLQECREAFQQKVATVMQDDHLLSGSITDNIAFFDNQPDQERVMDCARSASIHDDIMKLPMRYNSLIGDMGSTLSGGQKQRILLARALYRRPNILFLDEATSHLDQRSESIVNSAIREQRITRVIIAHRLETLLTADRILVLDKGRIQEYTPMTYKDFIQKPQA